MRILLATTLASKSGLTRGLEKPKIEQKVFLRLDDFMRFAIPQFATVVLLIHVGLGCCWHHAHACMTRDGESHPRTELCGCTASNDDVQHECRSQGLANGSSTPGEHGGHEHECEGDHCSFVSSKPTSEQVAECDADAVSIPATLTQRDGLLRHHAAFRNAALTGSHLPSTLRTHLLLGVLLI